MKRSLFRLLASCLTIFSIAIFAGSAFGQGPSALPFNYRVERSDILNNLLVNDMVLVNDGINDGVYIVGTYSLPDNIVRGFIYRYKDGEEPTLFDMPTLLGFSGIDVPRTGCYGMNESGFVVGCDPEILLEFGWLKCTGLEKAVPLKG